MRVVAILPGYYDLKYRNEGDEFDIKSKSEFSHVWMQELKSEGESQDRGFKRKQGVPIQPPIEDIEADKI